MIPTVTLPTGETVGDIIDARSSEPKTLTEAVIWLESVLGDEDKAYLDRGQRDAVIELHHSLGRYVRNELKLWHGSPIAKHLETEHNLTHPDDMSTFIVMEWLKRHYPSVWEIIRKDDE